LPEWTSDPFTNNLVPTWAYPPQSDPNFCSSFNPFLEVGNPQGNGATFIDYPKRELDAASAKYLQAVGSTLE
jgi:hypothetical protein